MYGQKTNEYNRGKQWVFHEKWNGTKTHHNHHQEPEHDLKIIHQMLLFIG
jgi:hypothetical protein